MMNEIPDLDKVEFPFEVFVPIEGEEYREGRLTINQTSDNYNVEIDIVFCENKKIYHHIEVLYSNPTPQEALDSGMQRLSFFLRGPKK